MNLPYLDHLTAEHLCAPVWVYDIVGKRITWANKVAVALWEADSLQTLQARDFSGDQSQAVEQTLLGYLERFQHGEQLDLWWEISPDGICKRVFTRLSGIHIQTDQGERLAMLVEAMHSPELLNNSDIPSAAMAVLFDDKGQLISCNPPFTRQFGDAIQNLKEVLTEHDAATFIQGMGSLGRDIRLNTLRGARWHHAEITIKDAVLKQGATLQQAPHLTTHYALTLIDIQERKQQELEIAREARSDFLTGLMNRRGLLQYMERFESSPCTLFYIDLDGFKPVNDTYGHSTGDQLLCELANVLMAQPGQKICARVGGDEFVIVFLEPSPRYQTEAQAHQLLKALAAPRRLKAGCEVRVSASLGIASLPADAPDFPTLMVHADAAMYEAKKQGRNRAVSYQPGMESWLRRRAQILHHLDEAIADNCLALHYQPIVNGDSQEAVLIEALLRWQHPVLGPLSPLEFITVAEESGKIAKLEAWVIARACQDLPRLRQRYSARIRISINISGANMVQPGFTDNLLQTLTKHQCNPSDLLLELTESILVPVLEEQNPCLQQLVHAGFQLAIDDFGTGYSSLAYISQLPARYVKIDRAFIKRLDQDKHTLLFIRDLCNKFGMCCIAEGVERESQRQALNKAGIGLQQGYYFARPQPLED
ncbi:MAG: EAL domain-containing protein [Marinobacterium sp.]|nr:EAL domain-containing protein [Marinobacterium sp.]